MTELYHYWGNDLNASANGDILLADGLEESKQRVLRRLLTNMGDYVWELTYGAGLPQQIGRTLDLPSVSALIRSQMYLEDSVSQNPEPVIAAQQIPNGVAAQISYTEADGGRQVYLSFDTSGD